MENILNSFFNRKRFLEENGYAEYLDLYLITSLAAVMYVGYGIAFYLFSYSHLLIINQAIGVIICIIAFIINKRKAPRVASVLLIFLVCVTASVWAYSVDVGSGMRWWIAISFCPLYFFSSFKQNEKILLTVFALFSFLISIIIAHNHEPLVAMPNPHIFNLASDCVIFLSIAGVLILYKVIDIQKEKELKRMGTILENIECGIAIIDAQTHEILDINSVATRMYGDNKENIIGKICHAFICPALHGACPITDKNQTVDRAERVLVKANGDSLPIVKSVSRIIYNGRLCLLESFTDISELKQAEEKLRLMEITERANIAKSEFLSRMSHEMRTPMNAIIGMAKIAESASDVNRLKYCLSNIEVSSTHLLGIINDILDMSKIEAGKLELNFVPLCIEDIFMKVCHLMGGQIEEKDLKLSVTLNRDVNSQYMGDELRLSQVIANLLSNAVKFTHKGGAIKLNVEEVQKNTNAAILRFSVVDTGIGMTLDQLDKLFNAFEQADGSITRQFGGTGLGLAISKSIIELMGGRIWVESILDKGSTFYFEIQLAYAEERNNIRIPENNIIDKKKLLIVDNDEETRTYLCSILNWYEIQADTAETIEALTASIIQAEHAQNSYDLIFISYEWLNMNGMEVVEKLGTLIDYSRIVIITSLQAWSQIENAVQRMGVNRFISKPIFPSSVLDIITSDSRETNIVTEIPKDVIPDFSNITLLLAEDVDINRVIFTTLLEESKIGIEIAKNGKEAVQKFIEQPNLYDVIIMDIQMPEMNGYEATKQIRALDFEKAKTIPIIAMSADAFQEDIDKCIACGMNDHLKKPIELDLVFEKLLLYCKNA